jgi:hypothetical protein
LMFTSEFKRASRSRTKVTLCCVAFAQTMHQMER